MFQMRSPAPVGMERDWIREPLRLSVLGGVEHPIILLHPESDSSALENLCWVKRIV